MKPQAKREQHWHPPQDESALIDMQELQERERVIEGLKQILVVLDHLAAHVDP
jgi:hypothetical protein